MSNGLISANKFDKERKIKGQPWRYTISGHGKGTSVPVNLYNHVQVKAKRHKMEDLKVNLIFTVPSGEFAFDDKDK